MDSETLHAMKVESSSKLLEPRNKQLVFALALSLILASIFIALLVFILAIFILTIILHVFYYIVIDC